MSTHVQITGTETEIVRSLLETCSFCDARAGEPCRIVIVKGDKRGEYICPDDDCEQLYDSASAAMSCGLHHRPQFHTQEGME